MKKAAIALIPLIIIVFLIATSTPKTSQSNTEPKTSYSEGNLWLMTSYQDFNRGELVETIVTNTGDGEVSLKSHDGNYNSSGIFTSQEIHTPPFEHMVLSWNADTPEGTAVKLEAQVLVNRGRNQLWSKWLSFGTWSTSGERVSIKPSGSEDGLASINTDTLSVKGGHGETAIAVRYRLTLTTKSPKSTPVVRLVAGTVRNTITGQSIPSVYPDDKNIKSLDNLNKDIDVPPYSQYLRDPKIASEICSPTSITSILNFYGVNLLPEETAWGVYDSSYEGFGNWPFSTAFAGSLGFNSYVRYCESVEDLKREVYMGYPIAVSLKYKNSEKVAGSLPVIHGAPITKTPGHIIVVRGFTTENGRQYVIVNDSAAATDRGAKLKYLVEEFDRAWQTSGRIAYIVHNSEVEKKEPIRQTALLKEIKTTSNSGQVSKEFELHFGNQIIDLSSDNIRTIMLSKDGGRYEYITPGESKTLLLNKTKLEGNYNFLIIAKGSKTYTGELALGK